MAEHDTSYSTTADPYGPTTFSQFFLEDEPRSAFLAAANPYFRSPLRRRVLTDQYNAVWDRYLADLGLRSMAGTLDPNMPPGFAPFAQAQDYDKLFYEQPRWSRGARTSIFNPRTRFLFGF